MKDISSMILGFIVIVIILLIVKYVGFINLLIIFLLLVALFGVVGMSWAIGEAIKNGYCKFKENRDIKKKYKIAKNS